MGNILAVSTHISLGVMTFHEQPSTEDFYGQAVLMKTSSFPALPRVISNRSFQPCSNQKSMYELWLLHNHLPNSSSKAGLCRNTCRVLMCNTQSPLTFNHLLVLMGGSLLCPSLSCPWIMHCTSLQHMQTGLWLCHWFLSVRHMSRFALFPHFDDTFIPSLLLQRSLKT